MKSLPVYSFLCCFALLISPLVICRAQSTANNPVVFPLPSDLNVGTGTFAINNTTRIFAPGNEGSAGSFAAYLLSGELADKYGQSTILSPKQAWANNDKVILIGTIANTAIRKYVDAAGLGTALK